MSLGIISRKDVAEAVRRMLAKGDEGEDVLVLDDEVASR